MTIFGHRKKSPTQSDDVAILQETSGQIWGAVPRGGDWPTVQAYPRPLPEGQQGIEFDTEIDPYPSGTPEELRWYYPLTAGITQTTSNGKEYAVLVANVVNKQKSTC
jgi:hypothetical protein